MCLCSKLTTSDAVLGAGLSVVTAIGSLFFLKNAKFPLRVTAVGLFRIGRIFIVTEHVSRYPSNALPLYAMAQDTIIGLGQVLERASEWY